MFITFEGGEGAGKSTVLASVVERLRAEGRDVVATREPGAGPFGGAIRQLLLHGDDMNARSELFLFLADRANHVETVIRPALAAGHWVLCDRYVDSTLVYQAFVRGLDADFVRAANDFATGGLKPDLTFLLDLDVRTGLARLQYRDRLDAQPEEFHEGVRRGFLAEAQREPRWQIVDASQPPERVTEQVLEAIRKRV